MGNNDVVKKDNPVKKNTSGKDKPVKNEHSNKDLENKLKEELTDDKKIVAAIKENVSLAKKENDVIIEMDDNLNEMFDKLEQHTNEAMKDGSLSNDQKMKIHDDIIKLANRRIDTENKKIESSERVQLAAQKNNKETVLGGLGIAALTFIGTVLINSLTKKK